MQRREFLKTVGAGAAILSAAPLCAKDVVRKGKIVEGRKLNIACVGVGGQGGRDVNAVSSENIVALCDVDLNRGAGNLKKFTQAKKYRDFRKMLAEMHNEIDAVTVTTPDHMHYTIAMEAIKYGKHVFVQKPLTHTVWEARRIAEAARKHEVITQMGNQGHAGEGIRLVKEWVDAGVIGPVHEVHIWTNRPPKAGFWAWPQGIERPTDTPPVPKELDWNLWLGVAPERPYHPSYVPFKWRGWWDFGAGALGDMGCHMMDACYWALDLKYPTSVSAESSLVNNETGPAWSIITYEFPARGDKPPVKLVWYDGGKKPEKPKDLEPNRNLAKVGQLLIGEKGTIMDTTDYCNSPRLIPESAMKAFKRPEKTIPRVPRGNHYQEWINAIKGGPKPGSNFDYAGPFSEVVLMGNLALRVGKKVEWDGDNMRCTNIPEANQYVTKTYRKF
ncbi:MAG: Gfo/Idh/MocA family oxidoreductase [Kiritimatiellia bacterium]|jgi:predicted dehydrogenase|nr:Gfo/Idh/MocA family oxidoreductase [Kiritimatiellia bacterium]